MATKKQGKDSEQLIPPTLQEFQEKMIDREFQWLVECSLRNHIQLIERAIYQTKSEIQKAEIDYNLNRAAELKYSRSSILEEHFKNINVELEKIKKLAGEE